MVILPGVGGGVNTDLQPLDLLLARLLALGYTCDYTGWIGYTYDLVITYQSYMSKNLVPIALLTLD